MLYSQHFGWCVLRPSSSQVFDTDSYLNITANSHIYGLPKILKDDIPLRTIVGDRGLACHSLSYFLVEIITSLTNKSLSYVKNSAHFVEKKITNASIHSNQILSRDVVSLFTRVLTDETLTLVRDKLAAGPLSEERTCVIIDNLREIMTFCEETANFGMGSDIYWQKEGLAMGSPLSPGLANVYMEYFEEMTSGYKSLKPSMWLRYVDDSSPGLIKKTFIKHDWIMWTQSNHLYSSLWRKKTRQQIILPRCINNSHIVRIQVICVLKANLHRTLTSTLTIHMMYRKESFVAYNIEQKP